MRQVAFDHRKRRAVAVIDGAGEKQHRHDEIARVVLQHQLEVGFRELIIHQSPNVSRIFILQFRRQRGVGEILETNRTRKSLNRVSADRSRPRIGCGRIWPTVLH